ncbi:hypothetical protein Hanom_Chr12g01073171 [Helianthus anomalus]
MMYPALTFLCFYATNFKELAPPTEKSQERINKIYQLPDSDRSFSSHLPSSSQYSSSEMSTQVKNPETFELDNYSGPVQVKQEVNPKPAVTSKPSSSKAAIASKPSTASEPRNSSSCKRKEPDSPVSSNVFPFDNHGFLESNKFMTGFLNHGLERLVHLYEDSCGLFKMLEIKLKRAETDVAVRQPLPPPSQK